MDLFTFLEVGISLIFVYLLGSIVVANLNELLVSLRNTRGRMLLQAIEAVLNDNRLNKNFAHLLFTHPQVERMRRSRKRLPAYISPRVFAQTLIDLIGEEAIYQRASQDPETLRVEIKDYPENSEQFTRFSQGVEELNYSDLKVLLRSFSRQSETYKELVEAVENWYEDYMDRVTGWYKQSIRYQVFLVSLVIVLGLNIDTIVLARDLWQQSLLRTQIVKAADAFVTNHQNQLQTQTDINNQISTLKTTYQQLGQLQLPIGWEVEPKPSWGAAATAIVATVQQEFATFGLLPKLTGWLLTCIALTFGAPFWFDVLRYLVNIRQAGIKPQPRPKPPVS